MANLQLSIKRMLGSYPLHAGIVAQWKPIEDTSIPTMCVGIEGTSIRLRYNSTFVDPLSLDECVGVLLHEVHHVLGEHIWMSPKQYPKETALMIAAEITANEWIVEPLPGCPVLLMQFPKLPPDEDAQQRYERLADIDDFNDIQTLDEHDWQDLQDRETIARMLIGIGVGKVLDKLSDDGRSQCGARAVQQAESIATEAQLSLVSAKNGEGKMDWKRQLRRYVGRELTRQPSFDRPPRRFPDLVGVIPGRVWRSNEPHVMAVIDTSSSITDDLLADISSELSSMNKSFQVIVVECDKKIRNVYPFRPIVEVAGRGGTDLRPPLQSAFLRKHGTDLVVYFSDGFGPAPEKQPFIPVVWCLTPSGKKPCKWGREIRMGDRK